MLGKSWTHIMEYCVQVQAPQGKRHGNKLQQVQQQPSETVRGLGGNLVYRNLWEMGFG